MIKSILISIAFSLMFFSCKKNQVESDKPKMELISQNTWKLDRFTTQEGQVIANNDLVTEALLLFVLDYQFKEDGTVFGIDKTSKTIVNRGIWTFIDGEKSINVQLGTLNNDFFLNVLRPGKMTLQSSTSGFLEGLGNNINLEFSATQ